jgi:hypothetical protein
LIRIAITAAAFDAITATLPLGSVGFERDLSGARSVGLRSTARATFPLL